jgi:peptidoglycan/LPS O-acetylase OafA/YrhL
MHPTVLFALLIVPLLWRPDNQADFAWLYELLVVSIWMPMMVWLGTGSVARGVWRKISAVLGTISYPLYITHATIYPYVFHYNDPQSPVFFEQNAPWPALTVIVLLCIASWLVAIYVDLPLRKQFNRILLRRRSSRPSEAVLAKEIDPPGAP